MTQTDEALNVQTEEVTTEVKPTEAETAKAEENKDKTRKQKLAEKHGYTTVEEFEEAKNNGGVDKRIEFLEKELESLKPMRDLAKREELKTSIGDDSKFNDFYKEFSELTEAGLSEEKAIEKAKQLAGIKADAKTEEDRKVARAKLSLNPTSNAENAPAKFPLLTAEQFSTLSTDKGIQYYKDYKAYWGTRGGKLWQ